jgi:hypothetical protein
VRIRHLVVAASIAAGASLIAGPALAAPTNARNAFPGTAMCDNGQSFKFVVNSANGQGKGAQSNNTAEWTPAHLDNGQVFHPTAFHDLTFTFTSADSQSQSFVNNDARKNQTGNVTCQISGSQTDPQGDTFTISGSVTGTIT